MKVPKKDEMINAITFGQLSKIHISYLVAVAELKKNSSLPKKSHKNFTIFEKKTQYLGIVVSLCCQKITEYTSLAYKGKPKW